MKGQVWVAPQTSDEDCTAEPRTLPRPSHVGSSSSHCGQLSFPRPCGGRRQPGSRPWRVAVSSKTDKPQRQRPHRAVRMACLSWGHGQQWAEGTGDESTEGSPGALGCGVGEARGEEL